MFLAIFIFDIFYSFVFFPEAQPEGSRCLARGVSGGGARKPQPFEGGGRPGGGRVRNLYIFSYVMSLAEFPIHLVPHLASFSAHFLIFCTARNRQ